jgi:outer membrane protein assembly factor BamA
MNWQIGNQPYQMRASWGFGIRFKTPVFPIRLDYAFPISRGRPGGESFERFNFTIGSIF